jgi:siroheme synthase-like protein
MSEAPGYPLFLRLEGRRVLLVGAGSVALGKLAGLARARARVTIVAPSVRDDVRALARDAGAEVIERGVEEADLEGARLVVCAAPEAVRRAVRAWCDARGVLLLAVDDVAATDAYSPAIFERAGITVALSSEGRAPALVGLLRELVELALPPDDELDRWLAIAAEARAAWKAEGAPLGERRKRLVARVCERSGACGRTS